MGAAYQRELANRMALRCTITSVLLSRNIFKFRIGEADRNQPKTIMELRQWRVKTQKASKGEDSKRIALARAGTLGV